MEYSKIIESVKQNPGDILCSSGFLIFCAFALMPLSNTLQGYYWYLILPLFVLIGLTLGLFGSILHYQYRQELYQKQLEREQRERARSR